MSQESKRIGRKLRNSYIVSTTSIALVVFMLGCVGYAMLNSLVATGRLKERFALTVMLRNDAAVTETGDTIMADRAVREAAFISKESAAEDFARFMNSDFRDFLDENPLPDSYEVKLKAEYYQPDSVAAFEQRMARLPGISEVVYQRGVLEQMGSSLGKLNVVMFVFGAMLFFISVVLLNNTLKVTVYSKRYLISTMKLVGATPGFIMRPFVWSSMLQGLLAGIIAVLMFFGMIAGIREGIPELTLAGDNITLLWIAGAMVAGGIAISMIFTIFAVSKFLRMHINNIHLY